MKKKIFRPVIAAVCLGMGLLSLGLSGCKKDDLPATVQTWHIALKPSYEVPALTGRSEQGYATLKLVSDNSLEFLLYTSNLSANDTLTDAHIHFGDPASNGSVIIDFKPDFKTSTSAMGTVFNLRKGQIDTLRNMPVYVNIHSKKAGSGLLRGQVGKTITFAADVTLVGNNEVPAVSTTATGLCVLRLTDDKVLYSKITMNNLEAGDALTVAHIHNGAAGVNGDVVLLLCNGAADFGMVKTSAPLSDVLMHSLMHDPLYVNVHSSNHGSGIVRGQIR